jgi:hypothetical protein
LLALHDKDDRREYQWDYFARHVAAAVEDDVRSHPAQHHDDDEDRPEGGGGPSSKRTTALNSVTPTVTPQIRQCFGLMSKSTD